MKDKSLNNYLESQGLSAGSIRRYGKIIERFESWREAEGMPLSLISYSDLLAFVKSLSTYSRSYQSQHLAALRYYFGYLQSKGKVSHNPATGFILRGPKRRAPHNLISQAQLGALYEAYPAEKPVQKAMLSLILFQALRREELAVLTPDQVELRKGQIRIPATRRANARTLKLAAHQVLDLSAYLQDIRPKLLAALPKTHQKALLRLKRWQTHRPYARQNPCSTQGNQPRHPFLRPNPPKRDHRMAAHGRTPRRPVPRWP